MDGQNKHINSVKNLDNKDTSTYTAFGDPISDSEPAINNQYTKATSPIAESTQNLSNERVDVKSKKRDTVAFGDPLKVEDF